jgi:hypothetical protein
VAGLADVWSPEYSVSLRRDGTSTRSMARSAAPRRAPAALSAEVTIGGSRRTDGTRLGGRVSGVPPREGRRFVVTTVVRGAPIDGVSGRLYVVDVDSARILTAMPIAETPWRGMGTNPRGGHRGGRGLAITEWKLAVANADEIHVLDRSWDVTSVLSDRLIGDIHELEPATGGVWVCSSRSDSLVRLGWDGTVRETWSWRDDAGLVASFGYRAVAPIDSSIDYRDMRQVDVDAVDLSHVNGVLAVDEGLMVSLGRVRFPSPSARDQMFEAAGRVARAVVVGRPLTNRLRADRVRRFGADPRPGAERRGLIVRVHSGNDAEVVVDRPLAGWPNHNVLVRGREIVLCETSQGTLVSLDMDTGEERSVDVQRSSGFVRGLACLEGDRYLVGSRRPAALHTVDLATGRADHLMALSDEWPESVHDIAPLPEDWNDPSGTPWASAV